MSNFQLIESKKPVTKKSGSHRPAHTGLPPSEIGIALDRSDSMRPMWNAATKGLQSLVDKQRTLSKSKLTLNLFGSHVETLYKRELMQSIYHIPLPLPYGSTSLLDGLGYLIEDIAGPYDSMSTKPKVLIALITDGHENSSRHFSLNRIQEMIEYRRKKCDWQFIYLCNDDDSKEQGRSFGFEFLYRFDQNPTEMAKTMEKLGNVIKAYQMGDKDYTRLFLK